MKTPATSLLQILRKSGSARAVILLLLFAAGLITPTFGRTSKQTTSPPLNMNLPLPPKIRQITVQKTTHPFSRITNKATSNGHHPLQVSKDRLYTLFSKNNARTIQTNNDPPTPYGKQESGNKPAQKNTPSPLSTKLKQMIGQSGVRKKHLSLLVLSPEGHFPPSKNNKSRTKKPNTKNSTKGGLHLSQSASPTKGGKLNLPQQGRTPVEHIIFHLNADKKRIPASLIKIFTASTLLSRLSPTLTFTTRFLTTQNPTPPTLNGNMYLKGGGDPEFVSESLWNLVNNLSRTGLKHIKGNLIVDDSYFQTSPRSAKQSTPTRQRLKTHFSYDAPSSALSFNWNTANIYIRPGLKIHHPLRISIDPFGLYFISLKNNTRTTRAGGGKKSLTLDKTPRGLREALVAGGTMPLGHKEVLIYRNVTYPALWTGFNALGFLKEKGITLSGKVLKGQTPGPGKNQGQNQKQTPVWELARWESRPLKDILKRMMKYSNNYMVEMLVKNLATHIDQKPGSLKQGLKIIQEHLRSLNITSYKMKDASGLSRYNRLTVREVARVLRHWLDHPLQPEFEAALPLAGQDGTLKKRFTNHPAKKFIRAKTGSLTGVSALAGYLHTSSNKKLVFVFLFNGPDPLKPKAQTLFEDLLLIVHKNM